MEPLSQLIEPPTKVRVLVVDDDSTIRCACEEIARTLGYKAESVSDCQAARTRLSEHAFDILLLNVPPGDAEILDLVSDIRTLCPQLVVIGMTTSATMNSVIEAMRRGASDYLVKPFDMNDLSNVLERAASTCVTDSFTRQLREGLRTKPGFGAMIGRSNAMEKLYRILSKVAESTHPVLILGESGTGKEMVARTIHAGGPNADKPFLPVDCGSLVPTLIESELFGHVKGAFTGASRSKDGLLVAAECGTVFLDEIGELALDLQAKLLRALQEKEVRPVGASHTVPIRARILAATNRDLGTMVDNGTFRKDLYYRLNVVNLRLPPLRDRRADIPSLISHFLERISRQSGRKFSLCDETLRTMMLYDWPGNVRELENAVEHGCAFSTCGAVALGDLPTQLQQAGLAAYRATVTNGKKVAAQDPIKVTPIAELERHAILGAIELLHGDKLKAAQLLGIGKTTLYRKLKEYGIADPAHA
ncbi:MAG TPA: sigma-54 dependent transcriptional regulator [Terracidiphilus sp.]|jgi:two-component system response regulator HydG|nr:sigma-54 dependent transcriptional regulator [Terracidiphilus sp.]